MAAGDAHRVWFPEMVEHLRLCGQDDLSMEALLGLRDELDDMLGRIRSTRHISNPVFKCPACGHIGRGADPHVSVRATILALTRFGVAAREAARALEKAWSAYRKTAGLDLYGQAATSEHARLPGCAHADEPRMDLIQLQSSAFTNPVGGALVGSHADESRVAQGTTVRPLGGTTR